MSTALIQGTVIRNEPAFRLRPTSLSGYHIFSKGDFAAFVSVAALEAMAQEARGAAPNEMIGALLGRPFQDSRGVYAIVTEAIVAHSALSGPVTVETTFEDERRILQALHSDHPIAEKIGWFHSHPFFLPSYSQTDRENQRFWSEPFHLGLLACLDRSATVSIYAFRGPESESLDPPYVAADPRVASATALKSPLGETANGNIAPVHDSPEKPTHPRVGLALLAAVLGVVWPVVYLVGVVMIVEAIRDPLVSVPARSHLSNITVKQHAATFPSAR